VQVFGQQFLSEAERTSIAVDRATQQITDALGADAVELLATREDFKSAVQRGWASDIAGLDLPGSRRANTAELLSLAGAFDVIYDAAEAAEAQLEQAAEQVGEVAQQTEEMAQAVQGMTDAQKRTLERFMADIRPEPDGEQAWRDLVEAAAAAGLEVPRTAEALYKMRQAGELSAGTMLMLAGESRRLFAAWEFLAEQEAEAIRIAEEHAAAIREEAAARRESIGQLRDTIYSLTSQGSDDLATYSRHMQEWIGWVPQTADALYKVGMAGAFSEEQLLLMADNVGIITNALSTLEQQREDARRQAEQARNDAIARMDQSRRDAIADQIAGLRDAAGDMQAVLSSVRGAMGLFRGEAEVVSLAFERSRRELSALARSGRIPGTEEIERITSGLSAGADDRMFATAADQRIADARIFSDLRAVESRTQNQLDWQERMIERLEAQQDEIGQLRAELRLRDT